MSAQMLSIAFYDTHAYERESFSVANEQFQYDIDYLDFRLTEKSMLTVKGYDVVCVSVNDVLTAAVIATLKECGVKLVALRCPGYSNVDLDAAKEAGLVIVRIPAYNAHSVAEHAAALLLSLMRRIPQAYARMHNGNFSIDGLMGRDLHGLTAGIVGTGRTGKLFAEILSGFGMKVVCYDIAQDKDWAAKHGFSYVQLMQLFAEADVISMHCPLTAETKNVVNGNSLALMKRDAVIINTGRGALIDMNALIKALKHQEIGGVALDFYEEDSRCFFADWSATVISKETIARLLTFPNVIISSHQGYLTADSLKSIAETTLGNILAFQSGGELVNAVTD